MSNKVGNIKLSGKDAEDFCRAIYTPDENEIREHDEFVEHLNKTINIQTTSDGFVADIDDLEL